MDASERMEQACEREEKDAQDALDAGQITPAQFNARLREIAREYRDAADEAANAAAEHERERW